MFVDVTAANDTVWHRGLTCKLLQLLPDRYMVHMIMEMVSNRSLTLTTGNRKRSRLRRLKNGVPQGSVLAPFLFNIYITDLPTTISRKYAYADDLAIMHADGDRQAVEGVLTKDMATVDEHLQTWKLKFSTTKTMSAAFHLNNKEAKRGLEVKYNNEPLQLWAKTHRSNVGQFAHVSPTPWVTSQEVSRCWGACWSNNSANSHPGLGTFNRRVLRSCLVPQCSYPPHRSRYQRRVANCDWMPASYTSGQPFNSRGHPTCWASSQWNHAVSSTPCHGAWTSAPLGVHLSIECKCTAPQIETPIYTCPATTHQFIWQQQHTCSAVGGSPMECGVGGKPYKTPHFHPQYRHPTPRKRPCQEQSGSGLTASAMVSDISAPAYTNGVWPPLRPVSVAQKNKQSAMLSSNV